MHDLFGESRLPRPLVVLMAGFLAITSASGCTSTPTAPSLLPEAGVRDLVVANNLNHGTAGARGRLTRWRVPIEVNTNDIARAEEAVAHLEVWSGGTIRFRRVSSAPANGLVFVEGGATSADGLFGCAHVTDVAGQNSFTLRWDGSAAIIGSYTMHLGSPRCDDSVKGRYTAAYAEHVLAHALGIFDHFDGFTGSEGLVDAHAFSVLYNLYANPIGATSEQLVIWPAVAR